MKKHVALGVSGLAALTLVATGCAGSSASSEASSAAASESAATSTDGGMVSTPECGGIIAVMVPLTGGDASIGQEQLNFAKLAVDDFNSANSGMYTIVESDTKLDAAQAATDSAALASNSAVIGVVGPASSQEVTAVGPTFKEASMGYVSASATNPDLTNGSNPGFFRVVPTDAVQGPTDAAFIASTLGAKNVVIIEEETEYGKGLSTSASQALTADGVNVTSIPVAESKKSYDDVIAKIPDNTDVVFVTFQVAAKSQQVAEGLTKAGKKAVVFGSDGSYAPEFKTPGAYVSAFAPDVTGIPAAASVVEAYTAAYGTFGTFGPPAYVATQAILEAAQRACKSSGASADRAGVLAELPNTNIVDSILGRDITFDSKGDVDGAKFYIFKLDDAGMPVMAQ
jgi:branched-chain amino acid transport system substrate-binding protein